MFHLANNPNINLTIHRNNYYNNQTSKTPSIQSTTINNSYTTKLEENFVDQLHLENELSAPICNLDIEEWLESFTDDEDSAPPSECSTTSNVDRPARKKLDSNLVESIEHCNSLEDLVKTFDCNVKKCLSNYKDIDVGQLAPVQVRSQEQLMNESQMWYTLTGNFGNLLPIPSDYGSKSLYKKYHKDSLDIKDKNFKSQNQKSVDNDEFDEDYDELYGESNYSFSNQSKYNDDAELFEQDTDFDFEDDSDEDSSNSGEEDDDELRDQLDMHSMILAKSIYNENGEIADEPYITAEEVLSEIETMMTLQEEYYDEMTPDSGCFSVCNNNESLTGSENLYPNSEIPIDINGSYLKYIKTFAIHDSNNQNDNETSEKGELGDSEQINSHEGHIQTSLAKQTSCVSTKTDLTKFNVYELNDLIDQIEANTKVLSDTLVQELASRDELEFEKETKNTFISLLMSIQEKRRHLNAETMSTSQYSTRSANSGLKKRHRRSMINLDSNNSTHLTTIIPYNNEIEYTVPHLQILNKLLKAIDEDNYQVPELLTNYILKVVCPT